MAAVSTSVAKQAEILRRNGNFAFKKERLGAAIDAYTEAFDLERSANPSGDMVEDIWQALAKAKYLEWELSSTKRAWKLQKLKDDCERALMLQQFLQDKQPEDDSRPSSDDSSTDQLDLLHQVFSKALEDDTPTEVPDYLCCKITLDILQDPVITPSGVTYEKAVLLEHLDKVGKFDPLTREPLDKDQLIPNRAIMGAVRAYFMKHGWAYNSNPGSSS